MKIKGWLLYIKVATAVAFLVTSVAHAQTIYKWKDEKGQWRFSDQPPAGIKAEQVVRGRGFVSTILGRSYAGISLDEDLKTLLATTKISSRKDDPLGDVQLELSRDHWPPGALFLTVLFFNEKLYMITVGFSGDFIGSTGGWDGLIRKTEAKYGSAIRTSGRAVWYDDKTVLYLALGTKGEVIASLGDGILLQKRGKFNEALAPNF